MIMLAIMIMVYFYYQRHTIIRSCCKFISKRQLKIIKVLRKGFERPIYWNEYKANSENKNTKNKYRYFLSSSFVGVNKLFVLVYSNQDADSKRFKTRRYYLQKAIIDNYNVIINGKKIIIKLLFLIYNDIKRLENWQQENYNIMIMIIAKIIID